MTEIRYSNATVYDAANDTLVDFDFSNTRTRWEINQDATGPNELYIYDFDNDVVSRISFPAEAKISFYMDFRENRGSVSLYGGIHGDVVLGSLRYGSIYTLEGDDVIDIAGGANNADGGDGKDLLTFAHALERVDADMTSYYSFGYDFIDFAGIYDIEDLIGTAFDDRLIGNAGDNVIEGGAGADEIAGGGGLDTASYAGSLVGVTVDLVTATGSGGDAEGDTVAGISHLLGSGFNDALTGDGNANTLAGGDGNDMLEGGAGADTLLGAAGTDTAHYQGSSAGVTVNLTTGLNVGGDAEGDRLTDIENLIGSAHDDILTGNAAANVLSGGLGNDTLRGMGGADVLNGGSGKDRLVIDQAAASVDGGADNDALFLTEDDDFTFVDTTFSNIETVYIRSGLLLDLSGVTSGLKIVSQSVDQEVVDITATSGNDRIGAGRGFDTIHGGDGDDVIVGGSGTGPAGLSILYGDEGNDVITAGPGIGYLFGGDGNDTIKGGNGLGFLSGGADSDRIAASSRGSDIDGGDGADKHFAGDGSDIFHFTTGFGRDNLYRFDLVNDRFAVSDLVDRFDQITIDPINGGRNTVITFDGAGSANKIFLHGVDANTLTAAHFGLADPEIHDGLLLA